jgi:cytochrome P450
MTPRKPVTDWTTDWDHLDPRWREDPYPIWDELRRSCPIAHTERYQGAYLPTRYEDVRAIANDSTHFSSRRVIVREARPEPMPSPPITSDPPHHKPYKQLLLPSFTAEAMTGLEPKARAICNELIDKFIADGHCDAAQQYTRHIPVKVIAHMLAVPETDSDQFIKWIHEILELGITDDVVLMQAVREMAGYFAGHIAQRRDNPERRNRPKDDLISQLLEARIDGKLLDDQHLNGMLRLLLIAGIDTTWSGIGAALWHLARTPVALRTRLLPEWAAGSEPSASRTGPAVGNIWTSGRIRRTARSSITGWMRAFPARSRSRSMTRGAQRSRASAATTAARQRRSVPRFAPGSTGSCGI